MKKIIISETQAKLLAKSIKQMINESQESKSIDAAKKLLISKGYTPEQADKFVRIDLRNDMPSLRNSKNAKFILGVTRMFLNGELSDATTILNIDKTIKLLALAHYNEYDKNLNGLSAEELINRFADARNGQSQEKRNALSTRQFEQRDYNIVKINSFEEASQYSNYTQWCVTQYEDAFNSYTANGEAQFYFCLKNGFENIEPIEGENCPLDEYGLSMIAVCVDCDGDLKTCTCRWNHYNGGDDNIMDEEQISNIVGVNFYQTFKPSNVLKEKIEALKGMTEIPDEYFQDSRIKEIPIPNNITSIGECAFYSCTSLTSVTICNSDISFGRSVFYGCTSLKSVTIPKKFSNYIMDIFGRTDINFKFYDQENISSNNNIQENMSNKKIIISETQENILAQLLKEGIYQMPVDKKMNKPYCVNPEKVLIVKKFLDKGFSAHDYEKIGSNGLPCKIKVFSMNASNGEPLKYMYQDQLQDLLIDRFQNMFSDKIERELFMAQVIKDWVAGKIGIFGGLSTNRLLAENMTSEEIDERANEVNTNPTVKQIEASNYKMGHVIVQGMPISIENPKGSKRHWKDEKGNEGYIIMKNHYGYFKKTSGNGKDGDAVDVFIGPNPEEAVTVYVVDQINKSGEFDESKVMLGFKSITDAKEAYLSNYSKDWKGFRDITGVDILTFKRWLYRKHKQRKPFADYVMIKNKKLE